ncbi:holo-ACP synthase [Thomasclavelia sp.]|uniref:holo-ACP synthase n=1 Tax=Thomasclavelia sp. TaxID=3025757 RepID=UPI0025E89DE1|nr:holo-ACP synthase [Thomasclavelia sp.]
MIAGIGCDIVDLNRLKIDNEHFIERILTKKERLVYQSKKSNQHKKEFLGGRLACKEAFFKAYGIEHKIISFQDIEILNDENGKPHLNFPKTFVSLSHEKDYAIAYVIVEK